MTTAVEKMMRKVSTLILKMMIFRMKRRKMKKRRLKSDVIHIN
jgi:hypothetical protein